MGASGGADSDIQIDLSHWPVVVVTPPGTPVSDQGLDDFLERFESTVRSRGCAFATVLDLRNSAAITPKQRRLMSERMRTNPENGDRNVATAMIMSSSLMRGLLTALLWLNKPAYPLQVFADVPGALDFCREQLANKSGVGPLAATPTGTVASVPAAAWTHASNGARAAATAAIGASAAAQAPSPTDVEARLLRLQDLHAKGMITDVELRDRREQILNEL